MRSESYYSVSETLENEEENSLLDRRSTHAMQTKKKRKPKNQDIKKKI
jgi:hypothetical protein